MTSLPRPDRQDLLQRFVGLISGELTREEVADWAGQWVVDSEGPRFEDPKIWEAVVILAGADLMNWSEGYLHGTDDFRAWLKEFNASDER